MRSNLVERVIERKKAQIEIGKIDKDRSFSGYASLFGKADLSSDVIETGAFSKSLAQRGTSGIRMLYQHDPHQPIGVWTSLEEDARGLFVQGRLIDGVPRANEVFNLMKNGALDGLSVGFRTVRARKDERGGIRRILEADLWEISIVTFPMLHAARVNTVKNNTIKETYFADQITHFDLQKIRLATYRLKERI